MSYFIFDNKQVYYNEIGIGTPLLLRINRNNLVSLHWNIRHD